MVVILQMPISHFAEKFKPMLMMVAGAILMVAGLIGFSFVMDGLSRLFPFS
jgi:hypothetical protein